jgi:NAD(P)-dependent dehydrogenase (short-subunit alcohol dehydrogenase family)
MSESEQRLSGRVAVVTGASRGAGCGIAIMLGAAGATVVTGRSTCDAPATKYGQLLALCKTERLPRPHRRPRGATVRARQGSRTRPA